MTDKVFSMILATKNRDKEVDEFLDSIKKNDYNLEKIEVIIVDQNQEIDLTTIINKYEENFDIIHIKSKLKGVSKNRNLGIKISRGKIISFPDDDCQYLNNTLKVVEDLIKNQNIDAILGRIIDENGKDYIKKWKLSEKKVKKNNFISFNSMITIFEKNSKRYFDESFGPGAKNPSTEDADYLYDLLKRNKNVLYSPEIVVFHPNVMINNFDKKKSYNYGLGFGAFCRKYSDIYTLKIFLLGTALALLRTIWNSIKLDNSEKIIWFSSFKGRIIGFLKK
ncbi:MAG: glycosyltransferase [Fusobacteriaceae bacterium]